MRYHVVYLIAGERRAVHIEAADAASALAGLPDRSQARFELLAVLRADFPSPGQRPTTAPGAWARPRRDRQPA
ncbi:MAG TPA: hypothetical protein VFU81_21975 [Thermomicrobiales bacterium]|nr:hypothetical protein [Thermomicrobiales bacterium]